MRRGGPELANGGSPFPTGSQADLLQAAIGPDQGVAAAFGRWKSAVDLEAELDGGTFRLLPLVFDRLQSLGVEDDLMARLKGVYRKSWTENQMLFHEMTPVLQALRAAGVKTMLLKGAPLAFTYYRTSALRPMHDLDLVVPLAQAEQTLELLGTLGWGTGATFRPHETPESHAVDLRNAKNRELDVHWHCLREAPSLIADDWFWRSAVDLDFCGAQTLQPGPTAMLLHTIVHGVRSNLEPPIRWIADSMAILRAGPDKIDWAELVAFSKRQKLSYRVFLGLDYLVSTYDAPVPPEPLKALKGAGVSLIERVENIMYLGDPRVMYRPRIFPLIDYWRFLRNESFASLLNGFPKYLRRRWQLHRIRQIPVEAVATLVRNVSRKSVA